MRHVTTAAFFISAALSQSLPVQTISAVVDVVGPFLPKTLQFNTSCLHLMGEIKKARLPAQRGRDRRAMYDSFNEFVLFTMWLYVKKVPESLDTADFSGTFIF